MALPPIAVPTTRVGKAVVVCALSSVCVGFMLSPLVHRSAADDDAPASTAASSTVHDADAVRASRSEAASSPASNPHASSPNDAHSASAPQAAAPTAGNAKPEATSGLQTESATIDSSFADTMQRLGVDAAATALIARSFAAQIDFRRDLRKGDEVGIVMRPASGAPATQNEPLAVRISRGNTHYDLFLHRDLNGKPFYYTADGTSNQPSFARYPLRFTRVSSNFAARRLDPVTHRWQSHDGVDLAAPPGTPVHATASGTISFIGRKTGYGKFIVINNLPPYQTAFAHLSRFAKGLHRGSRVRRGQLIGYVGETGWTTGPHLHYEVRVNHVARNPLTVMLPGDSGLPGKERERLAQRAKRLAALMSEG
jgi:murein DD-endopeptidase MepM/ murein hydrolase activator NlpD